MKILIIGSGGREHAIAWKVAQSPKAEKIFALPGNPGIGQVAENVSGISVDNHAAVLRFCPAPGFPPSGWVSRTQSLQTTPMLAVSKTGALKLLFLRTRN